MIRWAIDNVARQSYAHLELVLALHGDGFDESEVKNALAGLNQPARVVRVAAGSSLGDALNAAVEASTGELLAKMDDDDLYGKDYISDLVAAKERSGAEIVGKGAETVYLGGSNQTIRRHGLGKSTFAPPLQAAPS